MNRYCEHKGCNQPPKIGKLCLKHFLKEVKTLREKILKDKNIQP